MSAHAGSRATTSTSTSTSTSVRERQSMVMNGRAAFLVVTGAAWLLAAPAFAHAPGVQKALPAVGEYFPLGIGHILTGFDHLLFLTALVLGSQRNRDVLYTVTAFTLAHSITLALGV